MENLFGRITQFLGGTGGDQSSPAENTRGNYGKLMANEGSQTSSGHNQTPSFPPLGDNSDGR